MKQEPRVGEFADHFVTGGKSEKASSQMVTMVEQSRVFGDSEVEQLEFWIEQQVLSERYRLEKQLGRGGMGEVWKAFDLKRQTWVAMKRIRMDRRISNWKERFHREVTALQQLDHPNIVRILDVDIEQGFFIMELLQGRTLRQVLEEQGRFDLLDLSKIFLQICEALSIAHQKKLVHRDLKPENVFLCDGETFSVKLLDFGIAFSTDEPRITSRTGAIGTAYYMAPEQLRGQNAPSAASDLYSCGVLLYELFVGHTPTLGSRSLQDLFKKLQKEGSLFPSERSLTVIGPVYLQQLEVLQQLYQKSVDEEPSTRCRLPEFMQVIESVYQVVSKLYQKDEGRLRNATQLMFPTSFSSGSLIRKAKLSPSGRWLAIAGEDPAIEIWDVKKRRLSRTLKGHFAKVNDLVWTADGKWIYSVSEDRGTLLWKMPKGKRKKEFLGHIGGVKTLAVSPDMRWLATAGTDNSIRLWDRLEDRLAHELLGHKGCIRGLAFSADSQRLVSGADDHHVRFWKVSSGQHLKTLKGHQGGVTQVAFSPDNSLLASASQDGQICLWKEGEASPLMRLEGHEGGILDFVFFPQGCCLASASSDKSVKIWDLQGGILLHSYTEQHKSAVSSLSIDSEGRLLSSASFDRKVCLWELPFELLTFPSESKQPILDNSKQSALPFFFWLFLLGGIGAVFYYYFF